MGDGFSDMARDMRRADEYQAKIDRFFDSVTLYVSGGSGHCTKKELREVVAKHDIFTHKNDCSFASRRHNKRVRAWMKNIEEAKTQDSNAWAEILTHARMRASDEAFRRMHEVSNFSGKPVVVIVPHGNHRDPVIYGDFRMMHGFLEAGNIAFARIVKMPERSVKGVREGGKEIRESGWDDVRFISF